MEEKQTKTKSGLSMWSIISIFIAIAVIISISMFAYAKYIAQINGQATAQIAKFNFDLINNIESINEIPNLATTRNDGNPKVDKEGIAPDTHGQFEIDVNATNTDTSMAYEININIQNKPKNLHFYSFYNETSGYNCQLDTSEGKIRLTGFFDCTQLNKQETKTIYWNWEYETGETPQEIEQNDKEDSEYMGQTSSITIVAKGYEVMNPKIKDSNGEIITLTKENAADYYGKIVNYTAEGLIYKLFYVDFDNYFGDGAGTIYLKADYDEENQTELDINYLPVDSQGYKGHTDLATFYNMNRKWKNADGIINNKNEYAVGWLCSPSKWQKYAQDNIYSQYVNYAIAGASTELYLASYNEKYKRVNNTNLQLLNSTVDANGGYKYSPGYEGEEFHKNNTIYNILSYDFGNGMYVRPSKYWCLASPSANTVNAVCIVYGYQFCLGSWNCGDSFWFCPVISLKSDAILEIN